MNTTLDVLVVENHRHAADATVAAIEAAGHHVHRCYDADSPGFEPWLVSRIENGDVRQAVETAARHALDDLLRAILDRIRPVIHDPEVTAAIDCDFERNGTNLVVRLVGPRLGKRTEQAIAVRVLDAIWTTDRTFGQVDVAFSHRA